MGAINQWIYKTIIQHHSDALDYTMTPLDCISDIQSGCNSFRSALIAFVQYDLYICRDID